MNTKLYKKVHSLAIELLKAAEAEDDKAFIGFYDELKALCFDNEDDEKLNHPVQWETLADFTEESEEALCFYKRALGYAEDIQAHDYMASVSYAMAMLHQDDNNQEQALSMALQANEYLQNISDDELKKEIKALLKALK